MSQHQTEISSASTHAALPAPKRKRFKTVALGVFILICGMAIGSGLTLFYLWGQLLRDARNPERIPERISKRLERNLDLSSEQAALVREIMSQQRQVLIDIQKEAQPRLLAELDRIDGRMKEILTPEQTERWVEIFEMMQRRWLSPHGYGPPHGRDRLNRLNTQKENHPKSDSDPEKGDNRLPR